MRSASVIGRMTRAGSPAANDIGGISRVTTLDAQIARDDAQFAKLIALMESYFRMGGTHFQLNYVSAAELRDAQQHPERHRSLRVRVSGFSDYFVNLNADLQSEIVKRTEQA